MKELGMFQSRASIIWWDNLGGTYLNTNSVFHARTKHIEVDFHFVRERVALGMLEVRFISSADRIADIFTKALPHNAFERFHRNLNITSG